MNQEGHPDKIRARRSPSRGTQRNRYHNVVDDGLPKESRQRRSCRRACRINHAQRANMLTDQRVTKNMKGSITKNVIAASRAPCSQRANMLKEQKCPCGEQRPPKTLRMPWVPLKREKESTKISRRSMPGSVEGRQTNRSSSWLKVQTHHLNRRSSIIVRRMGVTTPPLGPGAATITRNLQLLFVVKMMLRWSRSCCLEDHLHERLTELLLVVVVTRSRTLLSASSRLFHRWLHELGEEPLEEQLRLDENK